MAEKYTRIKAIGKGAFGEAILVKNKIDGELYVDKEIHLAGLSAKDLASTQSEIAILSKLNHPNITQYIESYQDSDNVLHIILEYADGGDIHGQIKKQQQAGVQGGPVYFPENVIRNWFVQLCLALHHMHTNKVLHRDLKTRNVFLSKDNQVKLGDFGLSTVLKNTMAQAHTLCGTPYYFSPELCKNKPYNNKSDVWALGCIIYELCTLKHAFDAQNMKGLMQKILKGCFPPIPSMYSPDLAACINRMLTKDDTKRPSVLEILEMPFVQNGLKMLYHNAAKRTTDEENSYQADKRRNSEALVQAAGEHIKGALPALNVNQHKEMKDINAMSKAERLQFLKGPPPTELAKAPEKKEEKAATPASAKKDEFPIIQNQLAQPTIPDDPSNERGFYTSMRLPELQYKTLQAQYENLTTKKSEDRMVEDEPAAKPEGADPTMLNAEALRGFLTKQLGAEKFGTVYGLLSNTQETDDDDDIFTKVEAILGNQAILIDAVSRLVALESP